MGSGVDALGRLDVAIGFVNEILDTRLHLIVQRLTSSQHESGHWSEEIPSCRSVCTAQAVESLSRMPVTTSRHREALSSGVQWLVENATEPRWHADLWDIAEVARVLMRIARKPEKAPDIDLAALARTIEEIVDLVRAAATTERWDEHHSPWFGPAVLAASAHVLVLSGDLTQGIEIISSLVSSIKRGVFMVPGAVTTHNAIVWNQAQTLISLARLNNEEAPDELRSLLAWETFTPTLVWLTNQGQQSNDGGLFYGNTEAVGEVHNPQVICTAAATLALAKWGVDSPAVAQSTAWLDSIGAESIESMKLTDLCAAATLMTGATHSSPDLVLDHDQVAAALRLLRDVRSDVQTLTEELESAIRERDQTREELTVAKKRIARLEPEADWRSRLSGRRVAVAGIVIGVIGSGAGILASILL